MLGVLKEYILFHFTQWPHVSCPGSLKVQDSWDSSKFWSYFMEIDLFKMHATAREWVRFYFIIIFKENSDFSL